MEVEVARQLLSDLGATKLKRPRPSDEGGYEVACCCPIHNEKNPSAAINTSKEVFNCYVCGGMDLETLVFLSMGYDSITDAKEFLDAYDLEGLTDYEDKDKKIEVEIGEYGEDRSKKDPILHQSFFEHWGVQHPYIARRCPDARTAHDLGIHYDCDKRRLIWPVHNASGQIVGWSERWAFDPQSKKDGTVVLPRYVIEDMDDYDDFEDWELRNPRWYHQYPKRRHLYGAHLLKPKRKRVLTLVEGFSTTAWLRSMGFHDVAAIGGSKVSQAQVELALGFCTGVIAALDNDAAGVEGTKKLVERFSPYVPVYVVQWDDDEKDFDGMSRKRIAELILGAPSYLRQLIGQ